MTYQIGQAVTIREHRKTYQIKILSILMARDNATLVKGQLGKRVLYKWLPNIDR